MDADKSDFGKALIARGWIIGLVLWLAARSGAPEVMARGPAWPDFQADGYGAGLIEGRVGGLGFRVSLQGWPRLQKNAQILDAVLPPGKTSNLPAVPPLDFGTISAGEAISETYSVIENDWSHVAVSFGAGFKLYVSRLTPAVVVESTANSLQFFGGGAALPSYFATPDALVPLSGLANLPLGGLNRSWLLVWFGQQAGFESTNFPWGGEYMRPAPLLAVDAPLLFLFQNAPSHITAMDGVGLIVTFPGPAGRVALLPLWGDRFPLASETERWATNGLPASAVQQADRWASHLARVPLAATEASAYNADTDTISVTVQIRYLPLRAGGIRFAPLPPMLALAKQSGFPVQISPEVFYTDVPTVIGPYAGVKGVDRYTYQVAGLSRYVKEHRVVSSQAGEPTFLAQRLHEEIAKVVQAGHLAPWYPVTNSFKYWDNQGVLTWSNPGEHLFLLGEALPLLDGSLQMELLNHLRAERVSYPPETTVFLKADEGARRERWRIDPEEMAQVIAQHNVKVSTISHYVVNHLIPEENLYYLAEYASYTDMDAVASQWPQLRQILYPYLFHRDWATLGWYQWPSGLTNPQALIGEFNGWGGVIDINHHFAALIGALRLAYWSQDGEGIPLLWGELARTAILRFAIERYASYLYDSRLIVLPTDPNWLGMYGQAMYVRNDRTLSSFSRTASYIAGQPDWMVRYLEGSWVGHLYTYRWTGSESDVRSIANLNQFGLRFNDVIHPLTGKGLLPYRGMVPELARFLADQESSRAWARAFVDRVAENMPDWYHAFGRQALGKENNSLLPEDPYQIFLARAWILHEPADVLTGFLDVPWMARGDLYYIHKLAETIKAYRGYTWQALPGMNEPTGNAVPTPTSTSTPTSMAAWMPMPIRTSTPTAVHHRRGKPLRKSFSPAFHLPFPGSMGFASGPGKGR